MKKIIFVDDEPNVLNGLRRMLRPKREEWEMTFVDAGQKALDELAQHPFDVIVSDMRMPQMDGATLLTRVQKDYPNVVRIILSGHTEQEAALKAVPVAHQFLSKPCNANILQEVVNRACKLQEILHDNLLLSMVGKIDNLPTLPQVYEDLSLALSKQDTTLKDVGEIVEKDFSISAKILQLVNSAFFGLPRKVVKVHAAVSFIGMNMLRNLVLSIEVFKSFKNTDNVENFSLETLQSHALLVGNIAKRLFAEDKEKAEDAFMAGMLHDIGKLIVVEYLPEKFTQVAQGMRSRNKPMFEMEQELLGITHAEIGAYLLGIWGIPYPIVEAVANHHCPSRVEQSEFDLLGAVYMANKLAHEKECPDQVEDGSKNTIITEEDMAYLERLNVIDQLPQWRRMVGELNASTNMAA